MKDYETVEITPFVSVMMLEARKILQPAMVHVPTGTVLKLWSAVEGLEMGAWYALMDYAERAVEIKAVNWETDDVDFLFPCQNFIERFLDPVGFNHITAEDATAQIMEKMMREDH